MDKIKEFLNSHGKTLIGYIAVFVLGCGFAAVMSGAFGSV